MSFLDDLIGTLRIAVSGVQRPKQPTLNFIGATVVDDPTNQQTTVTIPSSSAAPPVASLAALRALSTLDGTVVAGQQRIVTGDPVSWVYDAASGAGFADDSETIVRPTDVALGNNGRWYKSTSSPVLSTVAALRLAVSGKHDTIHVQAYTVFGDGGGGIFDYDSSDTTSSDNNGTIIVAGTRRYKRRFAGDIEVAWFGGKPNGRYFHSTNGKWYKDSGFVTEADDDCVKFIRAVSFASTLGNLGDTVPGGSVRGNVHIPAGDWYFKNAPTGTNGEYVHLPSGISVYGEGDASCIRISPGRATGVTNTGYACVFGTNDNSEVPRNIRLRNFRADHNSQHNQMNAVGGAGLTYPFLTTALFPKGDGIHVEAVTTVNHAGRFAIGVGEYGFADLTSNVTIDRCQCLHEGDDPNVGDTSVIFCSATNAQVTDCIVDNDSANNVAWPSGNTTITAFEVHSSNGIFRGNIANEVSRLLNLAGDSLSQEGFSVIGNIANRCISGVTLYQLSSHTIKNLTITHNHLMIRQGLPAFGELGIAIAEPAALSLPDGNGIEHVKIVHNHITFVSGTPTATKSWGMNFFGRGKDVEIAFNSIEGFDFVGILWSCNTRVANAGNLLQDLNIHHNRFHNVGAFPIFIGGIAGEATAVLVRCQVRDNKLIDDRGGSSHMSYGISFGAIKTDGLLRVWDNEIVGAVNADYNYDTVTYANTATLPNTVPDNFKVAGTSVFTGSVNISSSGNLRVGSTSAALQRLHVDGLALVTSEAIQNGDNSGVAISWASNEFDVLRDTHKLKSANGGTTFVTVSSGSFNLGGITGLSHIPTALFDAVSDPGNSAASTLTMYGKSVSSLMQLRARYPSGAEQIIDVEGVVPSAYQNRTTDGTTPFYIGIKATNIADSNATLDVGTASEFVIPPSTLSMNRTGTLSPSTGSPAVNQAVVITRRDVTANTYAVVNGGPAAGTMYTFPASKMFQATFIFDGTDWYLGTFVELV